MAEFINKLTGQISVSQIICFGGLIVFGLWLLRTSFGRRALVDSPPRRNNMPLYMPFIVLFIWVGATSIAVKIAETLFSGLQDWQGVFVDNLIYSFGGIGAVIFTILLARVSFARRLKGFGLNVKTIFKDFFAGAVNLFSVWPLVFFMIIITAYIGKKIWGVEFEVEQHQELETIAAYSQLSVRLVILINAAIIVPVFEEMLFRGLFQTVIRSIVVRPWNSILLSSVIFTAVHINTSHWPALFVLAVCLGYAYEKSGSLFRPIFIHSIFNATAVIAMLFQ